MRSEQSEKEREEGTAQQRYKEEERTCETPLQKTPTCVVCVGGGRVRCGGESNGEQEKERERRRKSAGKGVCGTATKL